MKINKLFISLILIIGLLFNSVGCSNGVVEVKLINFAEEYMNAYINVEYDVSQIIKKEKGVNYSISASYIYMDEATELLEERQLNCVDLKFTQHELFDVIVKIKAEKGNKQDEKEVTIIVEKYIEDSEKLMLTCWQDDGFSNQVINDMDYLVDNSLSSLYVEYVGGNTFNYGGQWLNIVGNGAFDPNNESVASEGFFKDITNWDDYYLVYYIYNSNEYDLTFFTRFLHVSTGTVINGDIDWGWNPDSEYYNTVKPGEWKLIKLSLKDCGITQPFVYETGYPNSYNIGAAGGTDMIANKVRYEGPKDGFYKFGFYVDGYKFLDKAEADLLN